MDERPPAQSDRVLRRDGCARCDLGGYLPSMALHTAQTEAVGAAPRICCGCGPRLHARRVYGLSAPERQTGLALLKKWMNPNTRSGWWAARESPPELSRQFYRRSQTVLKTAGQVSVTVDQRSPEFDRWLACYMIVGLNPPSSVSRPCVQQIADAI
jgi:hypothetical protein